MIKTTTSAGAESTAAGGSLPRMEVTVLSGFPDGEPGIAKGVSACFAGCFGDTLLMAGGCNFPDKPASQGGKKKYYQGIYAAVDNGGEHLSWQLVGQLPVAAAYGVSVQLEDGLICIGGNNIERTLRSAFILRLRKGKIETEQLPDLPEALDNFTGAACGNLVCVFGGSKAWQLNLDRRSEGWIPLPVVSEERSQPVSGFINGEFCVWGGFSPKQSDKLASLSLGGFAWDGGQQHQLPAPSILGEDVFLGGGAALNLDKTHILALGGVNKDVFLNALNHLPDGYMLHEPEWYKFNPHVMIFDGHTWSRVMTTSLTARAGATVARHGADVYVIGGELKPGVRLANVVRLHLEDF